MFHEWITARVEGQSFIDIGGIGEWSVNETVGTALAGGASRAAMADIAGFDSPFWPHFHQRMTARGFGRDRYESFDRVDVVAGDLTTRLPVFDMVHSTGILYHLSDPARAVWNLRRITGRWLVTNTITIPERISNRAGMLRCEGSAALFLPGISEVERAVLRMHYQQKFGWDLNDVAPRADDTAASMPYFSDGGPSPWPYWFLFTREGFLGLLRAAGFAVREEFNWEEHAHFVLCEKI